MLSPSDKFFDDLSKVNFKSLDKVSFFIPSALIFFISDTLTSFYMLNHFDDPQNKHAYSFVHVECTKMFLFGSP